MSSLEAGHDAPPGGSISSVLSGDDQLIPPGLDVRREAMPMHRPTPMGPSYAINAQEILRRGFMALDEEEKASVIAAYLATQKQQLSPFLTPFDEEMARSKIILEQSKTTERRYTKIIGGLVAIIIVGVVLGIIVHTVLKQGVLGDSGVFHGLMMTVQEIIRVIINGGGY